MAAVIAIGIYYAKIEFLFEYRFLVPPWSAQVNPES
jgi:hypothetical protein